LTIRVKLLLLLLAAAVTPVAVSGLFSLAIGRRALEDAALELQQQRAVAAAEAVERLIRDSWKSLMSAERYLDFADLDRQQKAGALRLVYRQFDRFNLVALFDEDGNSAAPPMYAENPSSIPELSGHEPVSRVDLARYERNVPFAAALASGRAVGSLYHSSGGLPRIVLALRVHMGQEARGVLTAELSLTTIQERLQSVPEHTSSAFVVDASSTVLISGLESVAPGTRMESLAPLAMRETATAGLVEAGGHHFVVGFTPLPHLGLDWAVAVRQPRETAFAAVAQMREQVLFWIVVSLVIAAVLAVFFGQSLVKPIGVLVQSAQALASGTFRRIRVRSSDEIGKLSTTFNEMAAVIEQRDTEIRLWNLELQERVEAKTRELREAQDQLLESRKLAAVAELGAGAAHEINNPLFVVQGMSEVMLREYTDRPDITEFAQTINDEARRIGAIVEQLHTLGGAAQTARRDRIDLDQLLAEVLGEQARALEEASIQVEHHLSGRMPPVAGDRPQLRQVFSQIVDNARHAMPNGGRLAAASAVIDGGAVRVDLSDTGGGIPEEKLRRIFEPFFTTKTNWSGTGMGLAVVRRIVDEHSGSIKVASEEGRGTTVSLTFPVAVGRVHLI
jgi:signal transduction histidine kinase